ncbi:MAG: hypothetical protein R3A10_10950 [Caldilineaceae bacterium]
MSVLAALLFLAALIATGSGLLAALVTSRAPTRVPSGFDALDAVFAGVALAFCVVGLLAMPLVEFGVFSLWALTGLLAVTGGASWWWAWRQRRCQRCEFGVIARCAHAATGMGSPGRRVAAERAALRPSPRDDPGAAQTRAST